MKVPVVSIIITCFNQENYIEEAINSVLRQKVKFEYEIIISDDASQDKTPNIIQKIALDYPDIIRFIRREKNVGTSQNWMEALRIAKGEYVTTLEGDDYWLNDDKLQFQVDYLRENKNIFGVAHLKLLVDDNKHTYDFFTSEYDIGDKLFSFDMLEKGTTFSYTTLLHINEFNSFTQKEISLITSNRNIADFQLCMLALNKGDIYVEGRKLSAYRISGATNKKQNYNSRTSDLKKLEDMLDVISECEKYGVKNLNFKNIYLSTMFIPTILFLKNKDFKGMLYVLKKAFAISKLKLAIIWTKYAFRILKFKIKKVMDGKS